MTAYYRHTRISPTMVRIDSQNESAYLIEGRQRAALIDCCSGAGKIDEYVKTITGLPVVLLLTHGHVDHIGGAMNFPERYLNRQDWELAAEHGSYERRKEYLLSRPWDDVEEADIMPGQAGDFLPLHDGDEFDLGGVHLAAISLPGHTRGSMVILHREERSVILGDACNPLTFLFFKEAPSIEEYRENLTSFRECWSKHYDTVYFSHFEQADKNLVEENIRVCTEIMEGRADDILLDIPLIRNYPEKCYIAKAIEGHPRNRIRRDGGTGNIVYRKSNIFKMAKQAERDKIC